MISPRRHRLCGEVGRLESSALFGRRVQELILCLLIKSHFEEGHAEINAQFRIAAAQLGLIYGPKLLCRLPHLEVGKMLVERDVEVALEPADNVVHFCDRFTPGLVRGILPIEALWEFSLADHPEFLSHDVLLGPRSEGPRG